MLISIILPVYNEEKTILKILKKINNLSCWKAYENIKKEIIVIDDCSIDKTRQLIENNSSLYDKVYFNSKNYGKGYSVKKGLENSNGDYIIIQDADDEYDPEDYEKFFNCAKNFNADLVIGSRFRYFNYTRSHNFYNKVGNQLITLLLNILYNTTFTDVYSCYIFFKRNLLNINKISCTGFDQHAEIICELIKKGKKYYEVPINYNGRTVSEGKKIRFYHIFKIFYQIIKKRFI